MSSKNEQQHQNKHQHHRRHSRKSRSRSAAQMKEFEAERSSPAKRQRLEEVFRLRVEEYRKKLQSYADIDPYAAPTDTRLGGFGELITEKELKRMESQYNITFHSPPEDQQPDIHNRGINAQFKLDKLRREQNELQDALLEQKLDMINLMQFYPQYHKMKVEAEKVVAQRKAHVEAAVGEMKAKLEWFKTRAQEILDQATPTAEQIEKLEKFKRDQEARREEQDTVSVASTDVSTNEMIMEEDVEAAALVPVSPKETFPLDIELD